MGAVVGKAEEEGLTLLRDARVGEEATRVAPPHIPRPPREEKHPDESRESGRDSSKESKMDRGAVSSEEKRRDSDSKNKKIAKKKSFQEGSLSRWTTATQRIAVVAA